MTKLIHPISGTIALLTIATFWLSTITVEIFGTHAQIALVKTSIPWGFFVLIPAIAITGATGFASAGKRRGGVLAQKVRRMPIIAANGILVLIPSALYLAAKAKSGEFDGLFYTVQLIELTAGAANLSLLGLSMRDGLRLKGRLRR